VNVKTGAMDVIILFAAARNLERTISTIKDASIRQQKILQNASKMEQLN